MILFVYSSKTPTAMHRRPVIFRHAFPRRTELLPLLALRTEKMSQSGCKSFEYHAEIYKHEVRDSSWGHLGRRCINLPQKLQVEVHCLGPESLETAIRSRQNDHFDIMYFGKHAFCVYRTATT